MTAELEHLAVDLEHALAELDERPVLAHAAIAAALETVELELRHDVAEANRMLARAFDLAPDLETCEALLRGEHVPVERLNPEAVARYRYTGRSS